MGSGSHRSDRPAACSRLVGSDRINTRSFVIICHVPPSNIFLRDRSSVLDIVGPCCLIEATIPNLPQLAHTYKETFSTQSTSGLTSSHTATCAAESD